MAEMHGNLNFIVVNFNIQYPQRLVPKPLYFTLANKNKSTLRILNIEIHDLFKLACILQPLL